MSTPLDYESEYPYAPQAAQPQPPAVPPPAIKIPWAFLWRWTTRLAVAAAACFVLLLTAASIPGYRACRQASLVAELRELGCDVRYSHEWEPDSVPEFLREWLGNDLFSTVVEVQTGPAADIVSIFSNDTPESRVTAICDACRKLGTLRAFSIESDIFRTAQIADWPNLAELETLELKGKSLADDDLKLLEKTPRLTGLDLCMPRLTAAGLEHLSGLRQLESLHIHGTALGGVSRTNVAGFPQLQTLTVENATKLLDDTVIHLGPLPELRLAFFDQCSLGDRAVAHLATSPKLNNLHLAGSKVTDEGMSVLKGCPELGWLVLDKTAVTDKGIQALAGAPLTMLSLDGTAVTDAVLPTLMQLPALEDISLSETRISGEGLAKLRQTRKLETATLQGVTLSPAGVAELAKASLIRLDLSRSNLTDSDLLLFAFNDNLGALHIMQTKVTAQGLRNFIKARADRLAPQGREDFILVESDFDLGDTSDPSLQPLPQ